MKKADIQLRDTPLSSAEVEQFISDDAAGGFSLFIGKVRNKTSDKTVQRLEFEAYESMAIKELRKITEFVLMAWPACKVAIHHRIGTLTVGETAVIIGVSCPHRRDSIAACTYAIDTLKRTVPIWKKEVFDDGEEWVAAHP